MKLERQRSTEKKTNRTETLQIHNKNYKPWQKYLVQKSHKSLHYETGGLVSYTQDFDPAEGSSVNQLLVRPADGSASLVRPLSIQPSVHKNLSFS